MRFLIFIIYGALIAVLCSCSTLDPQSREMLARPPDVQPARHLSGVKFVKQQTAQCGPATLAMVADYAGKPVDVDSLAQAVLTESKGGSLQTALIGGARRNGLMAVPISGFPALVREIDAGNPVIALQNLGLSWWPRWHYVVVMGYDLESRVLYMHSGADENREISFKDFEIDWKPAKYWGLVVMPPGKLAESGSEFDHVTSAAILESLNKTEDAEKSYEAILKRWPESLGARLGLGNIYYSTERFDKSISILKEARELHPESETAKHNYEVALKRAPL